MAARSSKRVNKGFYKALNDVSTADFFKDSTSDKDRPFLSSGKGSESAQVKGKGKYFLYRSLDALEGSSRAIRRLLPAFFRNLVSSYVQRRPYCNREYN